MAPIKTSVIGAGMALQMLHWPSIACLPEMYRLHSVMDRSGRSSEKVEEVCGAGVKIVRTLEEVVRDPEVELVVVASPNATHFEYVSTALNAGKHGPSSSTPPGLLFTAANHGQAPAGRSVLVEKPITRTAAEAQQLADLAKSKGLILTVYQNRRWDSDFLTVRKLIQDGTLGDVVEFTSSYDRYRPLVSRDPSRAATWKEQPEGGNETIYNLGSHIVDQAYVLFGRPEKVGCRVWDQRGTGLAEAFVMDLYYPPPSASAPPFTVTLRASILSAMPKQQRFLIKGTKGSYLKYGVDPQERQTVEMGRLGRRPEGYGMDQEEEWGQLSVAVEEVEATDWETTRVESVPGDWPALYANLYGAVKSGDASGLAVREEQYIDVIKLIELGLRSSEEGRVLPFN